MESTSRYFYKDRHSGLQDKRGHQTVYSVIQCMYFIFSDIALELMAALVPMSTSANGNGLLLYPHKTNVFEGYSGITLSVRPSLRQFLCPIVYKILQFRWPLVIALFLAHLSTTCSRGAFRITLCPSCVVCRASSTIS